MKRDYREGFWWQWVLDREYFIIVKMRSFQNGSWMIKKVLAVKNCSEIIDDSYKGSGVYYQDCCRVQDLQARLKVLQARLTVSIKDLWTTHAILCIVSPMLKHLKSTSSLLFWIPSAETPRASNPGINLILFQSLSLWIDC